MTVGRDRRIYKEFDKAAADLESFDRMPRQRPLRKKEAAASFTDEDVYKRQVHALHGLSVRLPRRRH